MLETAKVMMFWILLSALGLAVGPPALGEAVAAAVPGQGSPATFYATATVEERPLDAATAAVTVLDAEEIAASGARTVGDLLRLLPGVHVLSAGTRGGFTVAQIRGGDPNFTLVLLDGVPLNDATDPVGGAFNLESLPVAALERVEVVRGPVSSIYGSTGLSGVVHLFTRRSGHSAVGGTREPAVQATLEAGDAALRRGFAALEQGRFFLSAGYEEEAERIGDERFDGWNLQATASFDLREGTALRLAARAASWRALDYPDASGGPLLGAFAGPQDLRDSDHREASFSAQVEGRRHRLVATFARHDLERTSPAVFPRVPASQEATTYTRARLGWSTTVLAGERARLAVGADAEVERGENDSLLLLPPFLGGAISGDYRVSRVSGGPYLEFLYRLDDEGRILLEAGGRLDLANGDGAEAVSTEFSPRLGLSWRFTEATRLRASLARAFKLPSFFAASSPRALGGNPELQPESAWSAEVGVEHRFGDRLEGSLSLFETRYKDLIDFDFATFLHVNRSEVVARGGELTVAWRPRSAWRIEAALTRQEVEDRATGAPLRHRPDWLGGVSLTWRPRPAWRLRLDGQMVSALRDEQIPVPERDTVDGHTVLGAGLRWDFRPRWSLSARLDNLLDADYETFIGFPGTGRAFRVGLGYRTAPGGAGP
jgi:vitamin B12 transporter